MEKDLVGLQDISAQKEILAPLQPHPLEQR